MSDPINDLAAEAAAAISDGTAYTYGAQDALTARILVVEEGGGARPEGQNLGAPEDDVTGKWASILDGAGFEPGMYSWWNAIPCGLDRKPTPQDRSKGSSFVRRAVAAHERLFVVIAVGSVAQGVVKTASTNVKVMGTRSPLRSNGAERDRIQEAFVQARLYAYPVGFDRD